MSSDPQPSAPDNTGNGARTVTRPEVYAVLTNRVVHAEQVRWTRLYNLVVVNTFLVLAWCAVFTSGCRGILRIGVLLLLSLPGLVFSLLWIPLGRRSSDYLNDFHKLAESIEREFPPGLPRHS
jgi:hypothetical protein